MNSVHLSGRLVCKTEQEAQLVARYLPQHVEQTRAEPGCLSFQVTPTTDPMIWMVEERFANERAFNVHQERVAASEWGRVTADIERKYSVRGLSQ